MRTITAILTSGLFIFSGCTTFLPTHSTCNQVQQDLSLMELSQSSSSKYSKNDIYRLRNIINDCEASRALSREDYKKYIKLLDELESLDHDADHILNTNIHEQRIK